MTTFYRLQENGTILDYTEIEKVYDEEGNVTNVPAFIREQYQETERKIIKLVDGSFAFEDEIDIDEEERKRKAKELSDSKTSKITELKNMRDSLEVEPIAYNGNNFDYDEKARDRISGAIIALDTQGETATISWTTADNTEAIVTANDLRAVIGAVAYRSNELHIHYRTKRELVDEAKTVEEVEAIVW